jgi:hypothetical protein
VPFATLSHCKINEHKIQFKKKKSKKKILETYQNSNNDITNIVGKIKMR